MPVNERDSATAVSRLTPGPSGHVSGLEISTAGVIKRPEGGGGNSVVAPGARCIREEADFSAAARRGRGTMEECQLGRVSQASQFTGSSVASLIFEYTPVY